MNNARPIKRVIADTVHSAPWMRTSIALGRPYRPQYRFRYTSDPLQVRAFVDEGRVVSRDDPSRTIRTHFDPWEEPRTEDRPEFWTEEHVPQKTEQQLVSKPPSIPKTPTLRTRIKTRSLQAKSNTLALSNDTAHLAHYDVQVKKQADLLKGKSSTEVHSILRIAASQGQIASIYRIQACVNHILGELREPPSLKLYSALILSQCRADGTVMEVERLLREMADEGFEADSGVCHDILKVLSVHPDYMLRTEVLAFMREKWFQLSEGGWHDVCAGMLREGSVEMAMERMEEMSRNGMRVLGWLQDMLVYALAEREELDEVLRLLQERLAVAMGADAGVSGTMWYYLLDVAGRVLHYDLASYIWKSRVRPRYLNPSSGICLNVMTLAARAGDTDLAQDVFDFLGERDTIYEAQHYELLMDAYTTAGVPENAFYILSAMQQAGVVPTAGTTRRLATHLFSNAEPEKVQERLESMFGMLRDIQERSGDTVPVAAMNVLIEVALKAKNLDFSTNLYAAIPDTVAGGKPDIQTFNLLLRGCHQTGQKPLALSLASDMVKLRIAPDALTYDRMMLVCLQAGDDYEDGVRYYREMRAKRFEPRFGTALILVRTLTKYADERVDEVLDELEAMDLPLRMLQLRKWVKANFGKREGVGEMGADVAVGESLEKKLKESPGLLGANRPGGD